VENLLILAISRDPDFSALLASALQPADQNRVTLPSFEILHLPSLGSPLSREKNSSVNAVIADMAALDLSCEQIFPLLEEAYPGVPLLCVSDLVGRQSSSPGGEIPAFILCREEINCLLFPPLLVSTISQAELLRTLREVRDDLNSRLSELQSIRRASLHLTLNLSLDDVLDAILESALNLVNADDTHVFLYEHGVLSFGAALFHGQKQETPFMDPRPDGITYRVARQGKKIVVDDVMTHPLFENRRWEGSIISLPLKMGEHVLGVMNVALQRAHTFNENQIRALEMLGDQASIAIHNAQLYQQAQQEIEERKRAEEAIQHLANHDALTGLPNRRLFNERISLEISHAERDRKKIAVLMFDLDHLKQVNDSYGHNVGDLLLQAVSQRLLGLLRKSDTVARMGGDEFLIILPGMSRQQDAVPTVERILAAISRPFKLEGFKVDITTSIGIALFPDHGEEVNQLVKRADFAMYRAKDKGGNTYHLYAS